MSITSNVCKQSWWISCDGSFLPDIVHFITKLTMSDQWWSIATFYSFRIFLSFSRAASAGSYVRTNVCNAVESLGSEKILVVLLALLRIFLSERSFFQTTVRLRFKFEPHKFYGIHMKSSFHTFFNLYYTFGLSFLVGVDFVKRFLAIFYWS